MTPLALTDRISVINCDCMDYMATLPDKAFELAIVDVPYGIGYSELVGEKKEQHGWKQRTASQWDNQSPDDEYWTELFRVSVNQIVWGGNYFRLPPTRCFIIWDKVQRIDQADCEFAWTSFSSSARVFRYARGNESGFAPMSSDIDKGFANIHPTQKPVALYRWLLTHYAKPGDRILDTHFGSLSSGIACHVEGFEYVGTELDPDYFQAACKRFREVTAQKRLFA